jgi:hypothetical protein
MGLVSWFNILLPKWSPPSEFPINILQASDISDSRDGEDEDSMFLRNVDIYL